MKPRIKDLVYSKDVWVLMTKDREWIACGNVRDRHLKRVDDPTCTRILTYTTKGRAKGAATVSWFYGGSRIDKEDLEPVEVTLILKEIK